MADVAVVLILTAPDAAPPDGPAPASPLVDIRVGPAVPCARARRDRMAVPSSKPRGRGPTGDEAHRWISLLPDAGPTPLMHYISPRRGVDLPPETMARTCSYLQVPGPQGNLVVRLRVNPLKSQAACFCPGAGAGAHGPLAAAQDSKTLAAATSGVAEAERPLA